MVLLNPDYLILVTLDILFNSVSKTRPKHLPSNTRPLHEKEANQPPSLALSWPHAGLMVGLYTDYIRHQSVFWRI